MSRPEDRPPKGPAVASGTPSHQDELSVEKTTPFDAEIESKLPWDSKSAEETVHLVELGEGQMLAGRFRVRRLIGRGGMGAVYEAEDLELGERVALKTILPAVSRTDQALRRFKREVHLARQVTHRNVCRIYDVFHHRSDAGGEQLTFLTMELLEGRTLADQLRETGRLKPGEIVSLISQIAEGLDAAHEVGIVHRDLKAANIMLVPGVEGPRAVVTDFGLAKSLIVPGRVGEDSMSHNAILGTPAYMAPEQVSGGEITSAADIYALGVVLFEMVTGQRPFIGDTPLNVAARRLHEAPPSPRTLAPELDASWESVILRCLSRTPHDRYESATQVAAALRGEWGPEAPGRKRWAGRRLQIAAAAVVLIAAVLGIFALRQLEGPEKTADTSPTAASVSLRRTVAVLGFKNLTASAEHGWLSTAVAEMLTTELALGEHLRTVPGEAVARARHELKLHEPDSLAADTLGVVREILGTDLVVSGAFAALGETSGGQIRLDVRVQDAASGETVATLSQVGDEHNLFELVSTVGGGLRTRLGVVERTASEAEALRASMPGNPEAARLYAAGLDLLRSFEAQAARELLEQAVEVDPAFALAHSALASAFGALGYDADSRIATARAFELRERLSREERLSIEGQYHTIRGERDEAVKIFSALWTLFPDDPKHGIRLAKSQVDAGDAESAINTIDELRSLPAPLGDSPRIDLLESIAAGALGDLERQLSSATVAAAKGEQRGERFVIARGELNRSSALNRLGRPDEALAAAEKARELYEDGGDLWGAGQALNNIGMVQFGQNDMAGTRKTFEKCLSINRRTGNRKGMAGSLNNLAVVLANLGETAEAESRYQESLDICREIGDRRGVAVALGNIALSRAGRGDLDGALELYEQALADFRELGSQGSVAWTLNSMGITLARKGDFAAARIAFADAIEVRRALGEKPGVAQTLTNLGAVLAHGGELEEANRVYRESLEVSLEIGHPWHESHALIGLANLAWEADDEISARRMFGEALAKLEEIGDPGAVAGVRISLARIDLDTGKPEVAQRVGGDVAREYERQQELGRQAQAVAVVARALVKLERVDEARRVADQLDTLVSAVSDRDAELSAGVAIAAVEAAEGRTEIALNRLATHSAEAEGSGYVDVHLWIGLHSAEVELAAGRIDDCCRRLELLIESASELGFVRVCNVARSTLEKAACEVPAHRDS